MRVRNNEQSQGLFEITSSNLSTYKSRKFPIQVFFNNSNVGIVEGEDNRRSSHNRRAELQKTVFLEGPLQVIRSCMLRHFRSIRKTEESIQKGVGCRDRNLPIQHLKDILLHVKDFLPVVGSIRDVHAITYFGRVDLFVFARDKQRSDTNELEFGPQNIDFAAISVNYADAEIERLWDKAEFHVYLD